MDPRDAIAVLHANLPDITDPELGHAIRVLVKAFPQMIADLASERSRLQRCHATRASIHLQLRSTTKRLGEQSGG